MKKPFHLSLAAGFIILVLSLVASLPAFETAKAASHLTQTPSCIQLSEFLGKLLLT